MAMNEKQLGIVDALAHGKSYDEIVAEFGVSKPYITKVKKHPEYSLMFAVACQDRLKGMLPKSIAKLQRILDSDDPDLYRTQIQAIKMILEYSHIDVIAEAVNDIKQPKKVTIKYE